MSSDKDASRRARVDARDEAQCGNDNDDNNDDEIRRANSHPSERLIIVTSTITD